MKAIISWSHRKGVWREKVGWGRIVILTHAPTHSPTINPHPLKSSQSFDDPRRDERPWRQLDNGPPSMLYWPRSLIITWECVMSDEPTEPTKDEVHASFPDPRGATRPENKLRPRTVQETINHVIHQLLDSMWVIRDDGYYCQICAPEDGYRIRAGADPQMHEDQRNPDTHKRNLIWFTIQGLLKDYGKIPTWPDCYRETARSMLWCHICRNVVGEYTQEFGERHDRFHLEMKWDWMRPGRMRPRGGRRRTEGRRDIINEILASRNETYEGVGEGSADYRQPIPSQPVPGSEFRDPRSTIQRPQKNDMERFVHQQMQRNSIWVSLTQDQVDDITPYTTLDLRGASKDGTYMVEIPYQVLDAIINPPGLGERSIGCVVMGYHEGLKLTADVPRICPMGGQGCGCNCHNPIVDATDAEIGAGPREPKR